MAADHNIEINVNLNGSERANQELKNLKATVDAYNHMEITPRLAVAQISQQLHAVRREIDSLTKQRNELQISLKDTGDVSKQIEKLETKLADLQKQYNTEMLKGVNIDPKVTAPLTEQIKETENQIAKLKEQQAEYEKTAQRLEEVNRVLQGTKDIANEMSGARGEIINEENIRKAEEEMERLEALLGDLEKERELKIKMDAAEEARQKIEAVITALEIAQSAASALSDVFNGLGSFADMFGNAFEGMTSLVGGSIFAKVGDTLLREATTAITGNIGNIISRYDIMSTFSDYMELAGVSETVANESLNAVDQSIRGIPIGLDEAAFRLRKYQMYLGDIDKATKFTIGIQKAITAGGASEQMKNQAYMQIDRLLATGKLGQSRQWLSLFNGLGVSLKFLREELALDPTADLKEIASDLASGAISTDAFINAIARLSENEGLDKAIEIFKGTLEAWQSNIQNAVKRAGQNILQEANASMEAVLGVGITGVMKTVRDQIDDISEAAGDYIRNNPQNTKTIGDAVVGLFDRIMSLDGGRFVDKVVTNIGKIADTAFKVFDSIPEGAIEDFASFAVTWAGPMSMLFKAVQSGLPMVLGIFDRLKNMDMGAVVEKIAAQVERLARSISTLLGKIPEGLLGDLMAFGLVWGKPLGAVFGGIANGIGKVVSALNMYSNLQTANILGDATKGGLVGGLAKIGGMLPQILAVTGAVTALGVGIGVAYWRYNDWKESVLDETGLSEIETEVSTLSYELDHIQETFANATRKYDVDMESINEKAKESKELLDIVLETDEKIRQAATSDEHAELYAQQIENIEKLKELQPGLVLDMDTAGRLANAAALREQGDAYIEFVKKAAEAEAAAAIIEEATQAAVEARVNETKNRQRRKEVRQIIEDADKTLQETEGKAADYTLPEEFQLTTEEAKERAEAEVTKKNAEADLAEINKQIGENVMLQNEADETIEAATDVMHEATAASRALNDSYEGVAEGAEDAASKTKELSERTQEIKTFFEESRDAALEAATSALEGFEKMEIFEEGATSASVFAGMGEGADSHVVAAEAIDNAMQTFEAYVAGLDQETREKIRPAVQEIMSGIWENPDELIAVADQIKESMESGDWSELGNLFEKKLQESGLEESIANTKARLDTLFQYGDEFTEASEENPDIFGLVDRLKQDIAGLGEIDVSGLNTAMSNVEEATAPAADAMHEVAENASTAEQNINTLVDTASSKAGSMSGLTSALQNVASAAAAAAIQTRALASAISSLQDKTVTITVNRRGALPPLGGYYTSYPFKGGLVDYLANGGHPGTARGSDIIPAWLTPGEFVMRRSAVGMFGSRLMDRLNHMDIGGAFDALMQRVASPLNYMHGNTYHDNHAAVNNYFYGDNAQNYSQRKAYRYARSL